MLAKHMIAGRWYRARPNHYGRFVADVYDPDSGLVLVFLDGDQDLPSRMLISASSQVEEAEPKENTPKCPRCGSRQVLLNRLRFPWLHWCFCCCNWFSDTTIKCEAERLQLIDDRGGM